MRLVNLGIGERLVDYHEAWALQRSTHAAVVAGHQEDTVLLVEHESVYTAGKRTAAWDRPTDGTPVVDVDRGGRITWHGPGQLVGYPIVRLAEPIDDLCAGLGRESIRVAERSGVWLPADEARRERKVAAIGVRSAKGVTMHG